MNESSHSSPLFTKVRIQFPLMIKAVMVDLDGTLLDTACDLAAAANMMLQELGKTELPVETIQSYIGKGIQRLVKRTLTDSLSDEPDIELFTNQNSSQECVEIILEKIRGKLVVTS